MFGRLFNNWAMKRQVTEATDFLSRLKSMNSDELGMPLVATMAAAELFLEDRSVNVFDPFTAITLDPTITYYVSSTVGELQKMGREPLASGPMVWAHTLRATTNHEVRSIAREIWIELNRGVPHVEAARHDLMSLYMVWPSLDRVGETPIGLEAIK